MNQSAAFGRSVVAIALFSAAGMAFGADKGIAPGGGEVRLKYASFDPAVGLPVVPEALRAPAGNELFLVQFNTVPLDSMRDEIRALGGTIERYMTDRTHIVRMPEGGRAAMGNLPFVRWVGPYEVAYRMNAEVRAQVIADDGRARIYSIETMRDGLAQQGALADIVTAMGGEVLITTPDQHRMEARLTPKQVLTIAQQNEVSFIDPGTGGVMETDMDIMRQVGGAVPTLSNAGFLGQGVRGEAFDGGVALTHQQWNGQAVLVHGTTGQSSHGAACFGINFATGTGNAAATGMMPQREQGIFCASNMSTQFGGAKSRLTLNTEATDPNGPYRSVFQTSSVGSARVYEYTTISAEVDDYLFKVDYLSCQSQSNAGNRHSRPQAWAKNIVAVGGLTHNNTVTYADDAWATGASIGPSTDLRQKPDLAHSFNNVFTTSYTSSNPTASYTQFSGTSSATPITAGHFGLLHQMWHEGVWAGFGGASSVFESRPKSTTAKALAINTAHRYPIGQGGMYRARVGWGMIHLGNAYGLRDKTFIINETDVLTQGEIKTYTLEVAAGEPEFKATMVFSDPQGSTAAAQVRINDLTLKVTSPTGTIYYGNNGMVATAISGTGQLAGANYSVPGGSPNTVDTVENVFVQNPTPGSWTVEVIASEIVQDARLETPGVTDADFALVVTGVTAAAPGCYANCDGSTSTPILNVSDFGCFLGKFAAGDPYANCDGSTGSPALNVADFGCFLTKFAAGCP